MITTGSPWIQHRWPYLILIGAQESLTDTQEIRTNSAPVICRDANGDDGTV